MPVNPLPCHFQRISETGKFWDLMVNQLSRPTKGAGEYRIGKEGVNGIFELSGREVITLLFHSVTRQFPGEDQAAPGVSFVGLLGGSILNGLDEDAAIGEQHDFFHGFMLARRVCGYNQPGAV